MDEQLEKELEAAEGMKEKASSAAYARAQERILEPIPEELKGFVKAVAWEHGHAHGWGEVLLWTENLVSDLTDPILAFEKRIRSEKK